jgi:hypothetical protein
MLYAYFVSLLSRSVKIGTSSFVWSLTHFYDSLLALSHTESFQSNLTMRNYFRLLSTVILQTCSYVVTGCTCLSNPRDSLRVSRAVTRRHTAVCTVWEPEANFSPSPKRTAITSSCRNYVHMKQGFFLYSHHSDDE